MALGRFKFMLGKTAFDEFQRTYEYRLVTVPLGNQKSSSQYLGEDLDRIELKGFIYPTHAGREGLTAIERLRAEIGKGKALSLIDARGKVYGRYYVERINEQFSNFLEGTIPRKIEFSISLLSTR
jgi:phage protein U